MKDLDSGGRSAKFREAHAVLDLAEAVPAPGLPFPQIGSRGAGFFFTHITHPEDAAEMVAHAEGILAGGLGLTFVQVMYQAGSTRHYALEAEFASGLRVSIIARGEHARDIEAARADLKEAAIRAAQEAARAAKAPVAA